MKEGDPISIKVIFLRALFSPFKSLNDLKYVDGTIKLSVSIAYNSLTVYCCRFGITDTSTASPASAKLSTEGSTVRL